MSERAEGPEPLYGPFHRLLSPTQTVETARLQVESGEIWGTLPWRSDWPQVQAYRGGLPDGQFGVEFFTRIAPDPQGHPSNVTWSGNRPGVRTDNDMAKIDCDIVKVLSPQVES